jgi:hypothetical protein
MFFKLFLLYDKRIRIRSGSGSVSLTNGSESATLEKGQVRSIGYLHKYVCSKTFQLFFLENVRIIQLHNRLSKCLPFENCTDFYFSKVGSRLGLRSGSERIFQWKPTSSEVCSLLSYLSLIYMCALFFFPKLTTSLLPPADFSLKCSFFLLTKQRRRGFARFDLVVTSLSSTSTYFSGK